MPSEPPAKEIGDGRQLDRDQIWTSTIDAGDPRLHGELWMIQTYLGFYVDGNVGLGLAGIDGEDGAWRGTYRSASTHIGDRIRSLYQIEMTGEGTYEGLSVILFLIDNLRSHDVEAFIPGEMPPMPEMQEPPAD